MKFTSILAGAAALGLLATPTFAAEYLGGLVKSADIGGKMVLTDINDMTLYTFDKDVQGSASNCYEQCAVNWPPLTAAADTPLDPNFTLIDRTDGTKIVAYKGWPLYLWIKDEKPGDTTGDMVGEVWHTAYE